MALRAICKAVISLPFQWAGGSKHFPSWRFESLFCSLIPVSFKWFSETKPAPYASTWGKWDLCLVIIYLSFSWSWEHYQKVLSCLSLLCGSSTDNRATYFHNFKLSILFLLIRKFFSGNSQGIKLKYQKVLNMFMYEIRTVFKIVK